MGISADDIAEFYLQLSLLVRARLPLPESLLQLSDQFPNPALRQAILQIGERTERGETFTDVLADHPELFSPFHVRLLVLGERSGRLDEMLRTVARFARFQQSLVATWRNVLAYPLLTGHVACLVFGIFVLVLFPRLASMFNTMYGPYEHWYAVSAPPLGTRLVFGLAGIAERYAPLLLGVYVVFLGYSIYLFLPGRGSRRAVLRLIEHLPGTWRIRVSLDAARITRMWSMLLANGMPLQEAMSLTADLTESGQTQAALARVAGTATQGGDVADALLEESSLDRLIGLTLRQSPEDRLVEDLDELADLYDHRVVQAARAASAVWRIWSFIAMALIVFFVGCALFLPLAHLIKLLGVIGALSG